MGKEIPVFSVTKTDEAGATLLAERIRKAIESIMLKYEKFDIRITASAGLATLVQTDDLKCILERCDKALYQAKEQGRNCVVVAKNDA